MRIVLLDGILGNPGIESIRWWILCHSWVLASVDIPVEGNDEQCSLKPFFYKSFAILKKDADNG